MGKPLNHFKLAGKAYANKTNDPILRTTSVLRNAFYTGYFTIDTIVWLNQAKVFQTPNFKKIQRLGSKLWLTGLVFNIINSLRRLQISSDKISALQAESEKDTSSIKRVRLEQKAAIHQLVWDLLDSTIPAYSLDLAPSWLLDDGIVGLAGLITAIFGLKQQWRLTA